MSVVDQLVEGREAFERREWVAAYDRLSALDRQQLSSDDMLRLAMAAHLSGDDDACVRALQQAFQAAQDAGEPLVAVRIAFWLGLVLITGGDFAVGGGWVARAQRLLADEPDDVVERGYLLVHEMFRHIGQGDFAGAMEIAPRLTDYGRRFRDADLLALGLCSQGRLLLYAGRVTEALALLDESMIEVTSSEVTPVTAGMVYCSMIEACQEISDFAGSRSGPTNSRDGASRSPTWCRSPGSARCTEVR